MAFNRLVKLSLASNQLYEIPDKIVKLKDLQSLALNDNKLKYLNDALKRLTNLTGMSIAKSLIF